MISWLVLAPDCPPRWHSERRKCSGRPLGWLSSPPGPASPPDPGGSWSRRPRSEVSPSSPPSQGRPRLWAQPRSGGNTPWALSQWTSPQQSWARLPAGGRHIHNLGDIITALIVCLIILPMMTTWTPSNCSWLGLLAPEPIVLYEILQLFTKGDQQTTLRAKLFRANKAGSEEIMADYDPSTVNSFNLREINHVLSLGT